MIAGKSWIRNWINEHPAVWEFILFNVLMAIWLIGGVASSAYVINNTISNTERAGTLLGTGLGASIILTLWVIGDVILGLLVLLTRPKA